jgi:hypothetical protein
MKALVCAALAIALVGPATAQSRYDRKLEEAVMAIVAAKIGDIRGGFAFDAKPVMVVVQDNIVMGTTDMSLGRHLAPPDAPPEGMARATDRRIAAPGTF